MGSAEDIWVPFINLNDRNTSSHSNQRDTGTYLMLSPSTTMTVASNLTDGKNSTSPCASQQKLNDNAKFYSISHRLVIRKQIQKKL